MFKNSYYNKNKNIIKVPKQTEQHNIKNVDIKPNTNKNYENIRSIVENNDKPSITNSDKKDIKNKLNIV